MAAMYVMSPIRRPQRCQISDLVTGFPPRKHSKSSFSDLALELTCNISAILCWLKLWGGHIDPTLIKEVSRNLGPYLKTHSGSMENPFLSPRIDSGKDVGPSLCHLKVPFPSLSVIVSDVRPKIQ